MGGFLFAADLTAEALAGTPVLVSASERHFLFAADKSVCAGQRSFPVTGSPLVGAAVCRPMAGNPECIG